MTFPFNVFEDAKGSDFKKHNKKNVTEDFVTENFKQLGWFTYRPFNDTGIDVIVTKLVCPADHSPWDKDTRNETKCECGKELQLITRFIQVKTREVKGNEASSQFFGYTLKSKDFRTDPRHVFLLYSDYTTDFIIIPMYEYLKIFYNNKELAQTHFGNPSFRKGNNKLNGLRRYEDNTWRWSSRKSEVSFEMFLNEKGIKLISKSDYDNNLEYYIDEIVKMKLDMFYDYSGGRQVNAATEVIIKSHLKKRAEGPELIKQRIKTREKLSRLPGDLKKSINEGYLEKFRGIDFIE